MTVELLHYTPLHVAAGAIRQCWQSQEKSDTIDEVCGPTDRALIDRVGNKFKHASTLEHLSYNFDISGVSRALLQELARHRMASPSVKSTRYTLKELKDEAPFTTMYVDDDGYPALTSTDDAFPRARKYLVEVDGTIDLSELFALSRISTRLKRGEANDKVKYLLPESYKTSLTWTINARSLQNFLSLRSSKAALWEIRDLAQALFDSLPEDHKYLFEECIA